MKPLVTEDALRELYITQGLAMNKIASRLGVSVGAIHKYIHYYAIPARRLSDYPASEAQRENARKLGKAWKGKKRSEESRKKMRENAKRLTGAGCKKKRPDGYITVYYPTHPKSSKDGRIMEHILVMEKMIGRHLNDNECVHHINQVRDDNRPENLQLMTKHDHMSYHMKKRYEEKRRKII